MSLTNNTTKQENLKSKLPRGGETDNCNIACSSASSKKSTQFYYQCSQHQLLYVHDWVAHPIYKNQNRLCVGLYEKTFFIVLATEPSKDTSAGSKLPTFVELRAILRKMY